jgi:sigma-B regulation protein RsbU (phosphoserine phosphatase)
MTESDHSLSDLLNEARDRFAADTVAVLLLDPAGVYLDTYAAVGIELTVRERVRVPMGRGFAGRIAKDRVPLVIEQVTERNVVNPVLRRHGVSSLMGVPLLSPGGLLGVLHVGSLVRRRFTEEEVDRLQGFSGGVSRAILDQIEMEERSATVALQRSLLPSKLPEVPGLELSARYLHATGDLGGDWYDVLPLPEGRVGLVMGDVAGHGFRAAVVMGRLRSALRAYSLEYADPAEVLHRLDRKIQHFEPGVFATVLYAVAEPPYCTVRVSSAGHPAPLLLHAAGPSELTSVPPDLPMGVATDVARRTTRIHVPDGTALVLFTDGLVERRPPAVYRDRLERLLSVAPGADADEVCTLVVDEMFRDSPVEDDTAVLVMRRVAEKSPSGPGPNGEGRS